MYEFAVGNIGCAARRIDARDPQGAEIALLLLPADVGELQPPLDGLLRGSI
jgi:hypothetical protein